MIKILLPTDFSKASLNAIAYALKNKPFFLAWDTFLIVIMYIFNMVILYKLQS